jgi:hypothetical protein
MIEETVIESWPDKVTTSFEGTLSRTPSANSASSPSGVWTVQVDYKFENKEWAAEFVYRLLLNPVSYVRSTEKIS